MQKKINQFFFFRLISDNIQVLWDYLEELMTQLNIEPHDEATVAIAYDTRFVVYSC
jgi:hypothetical protein